MWLKSHRGWMLAILLLLTVASRATYVVEFLESPCREWHRWPDSDMAFFDEWSRDIASGKWLQRDPRHPLHSWHVMLAEISYRETSGRPAGISPEIAAKSLWNRWYGGVRFHQEPLYVYVLAMLRSLTNHWLEVIFGLQLLAGIGTTLLIWDIARRCFGPVTGMAAGLLAALSPTLLYLDLVLLRESLITCAGLGLVWLLLWAERTQSRQAWSVLGLACGVALTLKATLALFALGCAAACLIRIRRQPSAIILLALFVGTLLLGISPVIVRNLAVGAPTFSLSSVATITFVNTNAADADPLGFPISQQHAPRIMRGTQGNLLPGMLATWRTHTPASLLRLMWLKWQGLWNWFEAPDNISFAFFRLQMPVLRWLPVTFAVIGPLSLVGLVLGVRWRRTALPEKGPAEAGIPTGCWPLYLLVANHLVALMFFTQVGRLRVPLVAALVPFAALTVVRIGRWLGGESRLKGVVTLLALGAASFWTMTGTPAGFSEYRAADFVMAYDLHYNPRVIAAAQREDWTSVVAILESSLQREPDEVRNLRPGIRSLNTHQYALAQFFANAHAGLANALEKVGRAQDAAAERRRSDELKSVQPPM